MKTMRFTCLPLTLAAGLVFSTLATRAQTTPRAPQGASPARGAALPEYAPQASQMAGQERDAERVFAWMGPFEPMLNPGQLESLRQRIHERLGEMRVLENRRRTLASEVLQTAVTADVKTEKLREKAAALGQVVTELAMHQAEILRAIQPALSAEQRGELRTLLGQMLDQGFEPLSFAQPASTSPAQTAPAAPEVWSSPSHLPPTRGVPNPRRPPTVPGVPTVPQIPAR